MGYRPFGARFGPLASRRQAFTRAKGLFGGFVIYAELFTPITHARIYRIVINLNFDTFGNKTCWFWSLMVVSFSSFLLCVKKIINSLREQLGSYITFYYITPHCWAQAYYQCERAGIIAPTRLQCGSGTPRTALNYFAGLCKFSGILRMFTFIVKHVAYLFET